MAFYQTIRGSAVTIPTPRETGWGQNVDNALSYMIDAINTGTVGISIGGNTAGTKTLISSGTALLAGGNNITLSQSGGTISILGAAAGTGAGISGVSIGGNSAGTPAVITSGTVHFIGGSNLTLSQNGQSISIVGASGGGGGNLTISASGGSMSSGSLVFSNSNGLAFGLNGSTITGSYTQSVHTHSAETFLGGVSIGGTNTSGVLSNITSGTAVIVGGNNVTLSQNGQSITISGPNTHAQQTGISGIADSASTIISGTVIFANTNSISFGISSNSISASFSQSTHGHSDLSAGISTYGNTDGTTGFVYNRLLLVGSDNITLSQSVNGQSATLSIYGAAAGTGAAIAGISADGTVFTTGTVKFSGSNAVTVKTGTGQMIYIDAPSGGGNLTISAGAASMSSGSLVFSNSNNLSFGLNGSTITATAAAQTGISGISNSETNYVSGTVKLLGSNMVTVKSGTGQALYFDATQSVQTQSTFALDGTTGAVTLNAGNLISLSKNASNITISNVLTSSAIAQPVSSASSAGSLASRFALADHAHAGVFSLGVTNLASSAGNTSVGPGQFVFRGSNNITLSMSTEAGNLATLVVSGANTHAQQTGISGIAGSALSTVTDGTIQFANSNLISFGLNSNTMTASYAGLAIGGISGGNTSGTAGTFLGSLMFAGGNSITLSAVTGASGQTITISGPSAVASVPNISLSGNTTGTIALISSGTLSLAGGSNIVLSQSNDNHVSIILSTGPTVNRINAAFNATTFSANSQSIDFSAGYNWFVHLSSNATITGMSNARDGERYLFWISNRSNFGSLSFPSAVKWRNASAYTPTTTGAGAIDVVCLLYNAAASSYAAEYATNFG